MIEILTPEELAELLRLPANKVILLARRGELPFVLLDGKIRFDAEDVEAWISAKKIGQTRVVDVTPKQKRRRPDCDAPVMPPQVVSTSG